MPTRERYVKKRFYLRRPDPDLITTRTHITRYIPDSPPPLEVITRIPSPRVIEVPASPVAQPARICFPLARPEREIIQVITPDHKRRTRIFRSRSRSRCRYRSRSRSRSRYITRSRSRSRSRLRRSRSWSHYRDYDYDYDYDRDYYRDYVAHDYDKDEMLDREVYLERERYLPYSVRTPTESQFETYRYIDPPRYRCRYRSQTPPSRQWYIDDDCQSERIRIEDRQYDYY